MEEGEEGKREGREEGERKEGRGNDKSDIQL